MYHNHNRKKKVIESFMKWDLIDNKVNGFFKLEINQF